MLSEKVVLVTGASGGIGLTVILNFMFKTKNLISASRMQIKDFFISESPPENYEHLPLDLTIEENVNMLFDYIKNKYGRLDIVINTIGGSLYTHKLEDFTIQEFNQVIRVNLTSAFLITKAAIKVMKKNSESGGNITHIVSSSAKNFSKNKAPYGIAKAGVARLIQYAAKECGEYNIKVNGISPTYVFTPRHEEDIEKKIEKTGKKREEIVKNITSTQILKRPLYSEDLIPVVELLSETDVITGQIYNVSLGEVINY